MRTAKLCLGSFISPAPCVLPSDLDAENEHIEPSLKALEAAAARLDMSKRPESSTDRPRLSTMMTEYYMLRIYLVRVLLSSFPAATLGLSMPLVLASRQTGYRRALVL